MTGKTELMKLKLVEIEGKTYAEVQDGKPLFVHDDGKESPFDAPSTLATISRLNAESKGHREAKEAAEKALKAFEGISDPKAALDAINKVKSFNEKDMIEAGKVEEIKNEAIKAVRAEFEPVVKERDTLKNQLNDEMIGGSFSRSKYIAEKISVPADMVQAQFGRHFSIENGKRVAKDSNGNLIYSKSNPGELAGFDEALETLVNQYSHKDTILKGTGNSGGGSQGGNGGGNGGAKTLTRAEFNDLSQSERAAKFKDGYKVVDAA